jgi:hypothetical protein
MKVLKSLGMVLVLLFALMTVYMVSLFNETEDIDAFCNAMKPGLDVHEIPKIAQRFNVAPKRVQDPKSIANHTLGIKVEGKEDIWSFAVAAPATVGEYACVVRHNYHQVLSASLNP